MSTVADVSLAIIAATCVILLLATTVLIVLLWRVARRIEAMTVLIQRALPDLIAEARAILGRVDREIVGEVARAVTRVSGVVGSGVSSFEQVQTTARRVAEDVVLPRVATAAGLWAAIREGFTWFRPGGDGERR